MVPEEIHQDHPVPPAGKSEFRKKFARLTLAGEISFLSRSFVFHPCEPKS